MAPNRALSLLRVCSLICASWLPIPSIDPLRFWPLSATRRVLGNAGVAYQPIRWPKRRYALALSLQQHSCCTTLEQKL